MIFFSFLSLYSKGTEPLSSVGPKFILVCWWIHFCNQQKCALTGSWEGKKADKNVSETFLSDYPAKERIIQMRNRNTPFFQVNCCIGGKRSRRVNLMQSFWWLIVISLFFISEYGSVQMAWWICKECPCRSNNTFWLSGLSISSLHTCQFDHIFMPFLVQE